MYMFKRSECEMFIAVEKKIQLNMF
jgi:hypothetical protein